MEAGTIQITQEARMPSAKKTGKKKIRLTATRRVKPSALKRKNLILDQAKIDRAKEVLGVATETEAITRALDAVNDLAVFREEVESGLDKLVGKGGFSDRFGPTAP
jgi:hypothetical protein